MNETPGSEDEPIEEMANGEPPRDEDEMDEVPILDEAMLPEIVTELATASERHTWRLVALGNQLDGQAEALEALEETFKVLEKGLTEKIELIRPSRWAWEFLTQDEATQLWQETRWFVDYLVRRYPLVSEVSIPPCWYRHTIAVDELSDVYAAWREAFCSSDRPSTEMTAWRDRWLWPMLHRLASYAGWRECKERRLHVEPSARREGTDEGFAEFVETDVAMRPEIRAETYAWPTEKPGSSTT